MSSGPVFSDIVRRKNETVQCCQRNLQASLLLNQFGLLTNLELITVTDLHYLVLTLDPGIGYAPLESQPLGGLISQEGSGRQALNSHSPPLHPALSFPWTGNEGPEQGNDFTCFYSACWKQSGGQAVNRGLCSQFQNTLSWETISFKGDSGSITLWEL